MDQDALQGHELTEATHDEILPPGLKEYVESHVTREQLAQAFGCNIETISRAVDRGELPQPIRFRGRDVWTVDVLEDHRRKRFEEAARAKLQATSNVARFRRGAQ
jgi:hypothetical protein